MWLGFDACLERDVAVKLMHAEAATDPAAMRQWLQEARSMSRLTHLSIGPVFEADMHAQQPYRVFEYVRGPALVQHLKARGALRAVEVVAMVVGVLDALHNAHAAGVVDRDLKPSNIRVTGNGRQVAKPKLTQERPQADDIRNPPPRGIESSGKAIVTQEHPRKCLRHSDRPEVNQSGEATLS